MLNKKNIPNLITSLNLFSGCAGLVMVMQGNLYMAAMFIYIAAVFDFLDGTAARMLDARSELGKQLDSLADVVSFGVLPGLIMFRLIDYAVDFQYPDSPYLPTLAYVALLVPVTSAIRLGRFNLDVRQSENFIGLPTPANALFLSGFPVILTSHGFALHLVDMKLMSFLWDPFFMAVICLLCSILLNTEIPLFSLKFKSFSWKANSYKYIFLGISVLLLAFFQFAALLFIIPVYIVLSVIFRKSFWKMD
jgi:CDP-diacylglycerol---serine O-phosphatidyltransferase